ncbi:TonB-dependent receptor [Hephaestia sp. GCM10023244]|uniref:TonB-dependent receptor n=1 Tax=unclassified Hephaestia TaxID=2631281 RepID=UPI00207764B7|nr:TonB-dependent receptor [Hephaestia sp. MAHUQ-44]MCM8731648.1 TonB-dependent receptor [Hephaestia sp. MAHUQ-44]
MKNSLLVSASAAAFILLSGTALAQTASSSAEPDSDAPAQDEARTSANDIIVTATRRNERLQDVPLSVTAFSQADLTEKGIVGYEGLAQNTPGVVINKPTANFNNFTARGIATNGYGANLQGTVAIYIDELPISANGNSTIIDPNLFDVERVEFLRGPQGTLFGSGSLAGAMRIITKKPDLTKFDVAGLADLGLTGSDSFRQRYNAMINVPLVEDQLALRVVGFYRHEEGYLDNIGTGVHNSNTLKDWGGRAALLWAPTDRLAIKLLASYEDSYPEDSSLTAPQLGREKRNSDRPDIFSGKIAIYNGTLDYQFNGAHLTSSTTVSRFNQKFFVDLANTFAFTVPFRLDASAYDKLFVQEARLVSDPGGRFDWVVGGFYYYKRRDVDYAYRSSDAYLAARGFTGLPNDTYQLFGAHAISHELAGFGELTYRFADDVWLTGGLRYGSTDAQAFTEDWGYNSNYLAAALTPGFTGPLTITPISAAIGDKVSANKLSYKISASYKPSSSLTTYATVATGFRTPLVNARAGAVSVVDPTDIVIPYGANSDKIINYEVGLKGSWLRGKLTANLAAYLIDWSDIQVQANRVSDSIQFATNIGGARSRGFEFEITAVPANGLTIGVNGSINDAKVTKLTPIEAAISGATLRTRLASPHLQGSAYIRYAHSLGNGTQGWVAANVAHVGSFPGLFPYVAGKPGVINPTYDYTDTYNNVTLNAGVTRGKLSATVYVENLFDDHSVTYVHPEAFLASRYGTLRPRTVGIRLGYNL